MNAELVFKDVIVEFDNLPPEASGLLVPGLENLGFTTPLEINEEFSSHVNFKMKLVSIAGIYPSSLPLQGYRFISCRFEFQMIKVEDAYYFNHEQLIKGDTIQFRTSKYLYKGIVVDW